MGLGFKNDKLILNSSSYTTSYGSDLSTDGGYEVWNDPVTLASWQTDFFGTGTGGSFNQETTIVNGGSSAIRIEHLLDDGTTFRFSQSLNGLFVGRNYRTSIYSRNNGNGFAYGLYLNDIPASAGQIFNWATNQWETFFSLLSVTSEQLYPIVLTDTYTKYYLPPVPVPSSGVINYGFVGDYGSIDGNIIYFDDFVIEAESATATATADVVEVKNTGAYIIQDVSASGIPKIFELITVNNTGGTASTEWPSVSWDLSAAKTWETGAISVQREFFIGSPNYSAVGASTIDYASTFNINGGPAGRANMTIANSASLLLDFWASNSDKAHQSVIAIPGIEFGTGNVTERSAIKISDWATNYFGNQTANITNIYGIHIPIINLQSTTNTRTITGNVASLYIAGALNVSTLMSYAGTSYSIFVDAGLSRFDGGIFLNASSITGVGTTIYGFEASGADQVGGTITVRPGNGTGTGGSGSLLFQTAPTSTTSSTPNTMATRFTIAPTGSCTFDIPGTKTLTINNTLADGTAGIVSTIATSGTGVAARQGFTLTMTAGATGSGFSGAFSADNQVAMTSTAYNSDTGVAGYCYRPSGNRGLSAYMHSNTTGHNIGGLYIATGGAVNYGLFTSSTGTKASAYNIGIFGNGLNGGATSYQFGGIFMLMNSASAPVWGTSAALVCDNVSQTSDIFDARDNNVSVFKIADGGLVSLTGSISQLDNQYHYFGTGSDMSVFYDGTNGNISTALVAPSDLNVACGTDKTLVLTESVWEDIQFPVAGAKVPAANAPNWETFTTNTEEYAFGINEYIHLQANEPPHGWKEGTVGSAHIHFTTKTAQNTGANRYAKFELIFAYADVNGVWTEQAALTAEYTIPTGTAALTHFLLSDGNVTLTGLHLGSQIKCRVKRIAATGGTEYADDVFITQVGVHIEKDTLGSRTVAAK